MVGAPKTIRARDIAHLAWQLYRDVPVARRVLLWGRPFISRMELLTGRVPAGSTLLDVGCGAGLFILSLAVTGQISAALGIDVSARAIAVARQAARRLTERHPHLEGKLSFTQVVPAGPWPAGTFDVVSLIDFMHHVHLLAQQRLLQEAAARVRPSGILLYKDMADAPWWRAGFNRAHDLLVARQWIHYAPLERVEAWATQLRLKTLSRQSYTAGPYGHEEIVFRKES